MFRKMPFILLAIILGIILLQKIMPLPLQSFLYALSLSIKSLLIFVLPILIFLLLFKMAAHLAKSATKLIVLILAAVICSNFISTMISYNVGSWIYHFDLSIITPKNFVELTPMWSFTLPTLIPNDYAMFSGLILGIILSLYKHSLSEKLCRYSEKIVGFLLRAIITIIPVFIAGFIVKLCHDQVLKTIVKDYALIFIVVAVAQFTYIVFIYWAVNRFQFSKAFVTLKNIFPALLVGFGSMSSAAAMPLTIIGAEKNAKNPELAGSIIPATVNIHLIGDCFAIPIFAFAVLKNFGAAEPAFFSYLIFALYFVLAKFSVAAVPGGGILVMLPILEAHLGFTPEMLSLITALYILFDPVITSANVLGNGGFAQVIDKLPFGFLKAKNRSSRKSDLEK